MNLYCHFCLRFKSPDTDVSDELVKEDSSLHPILTLALTKRMRKTSTRTPDDYSIEYCRQFPGSRWVYFQGGVDDPYTFSGSGSTFQSSSRDQLGLVLLLLESQPRILSFVLW
uniref:Uncharacterized protein n=1 Tax=Spongospora subterranea TaxID=70186 RepID=A0A0H5QZG9_9EUKA|eukprot:CRZ07323.1 hypothetical protein [Spongospora subterranea]